MRRLHSADRAGFPAGSKGGPTPPPKKSRAMDVRHLTPGPVKSSSCRRWWRRQEAPRAQLDQPRKKDRRCSGLKPAQGQYGAWNASQLAQSWHSLAVIASPAAWARAANSSILLAVERRCCRSVLPWLAARNAVKAGLFNVSLLLIMRIHIIAMSCQLEGCPWVQSVIMRLLHSLCLAEAAGPVYPGATRQAISRPSSWAPRRFPPPGGRTGPWRAPWSGGSG
jgi:hypothetical protein